MEKLYPHKNVLYVLCTILVLSFFYFVLLSAPKYFPVGEIMRVEEGSSLRSLSSTLKNENIVRSRVAFEFFVIIFGGEKYIQAADYLFENKLPVFEIARRIVKGERHLPPVSVTIPEGFNRKEISDTFGPELVNFSKTEFMLKTKDLEGYLFPDTYFFLTNDNEDEVIEHMNNNFKKKIAPVLPEIVTLGKTEKDIIIMASVIEREAKGDTDREIISGILWKRIKIGMALQADAAPETYQAKGLPKSPIGNPGMEAIRAAMYPQNSPYLYYLHDKDGVIHYAKNFTEHTVNIIKYLR